MADCSDGGGQVNSSVLPDHLNLDSLVESDQMKEDDEEEEMPGEETGASLLGDILEMEGTEADLKEEDASLMEALAECEGKEEEDDADYGTEDEEGDDEEESEDEEDDEADESEEESEEEVGEFDQSKGTEESIDFGEMPDFTSMMEADGSSLEGTVAGDIGLKALQDSELMDTDSNPIKLEQESSNDKGSPAKKMSRKRKKKRLGKEKGKQLTKKIKREKRKKKKDKTGEEESKVDPSTLKASERRRNIRKILGEKDLEQETLDAQKEELERQQRLMEQKKQALSNLAAASSKPPVVSSTTTTSTASTATSSKEQDSQLKSLLQSAEEEAEKQEKKQAEISVMTEIKKEPIVKQEKVDVIELSSDSEDESNEDDCVMVPSTEEEEEEDLEAEDLNDGGAHINDEYNCPDDQGRVLINVGHPSEDPDIFLSPQMAKVIKPHQIGGVRFLYDNLVESLPRFNTSQGFGCILAHSMGLGKTIQVIAFIDIFLRHTSAKKVLCIVPINTLQNWMAEFNMWAPSKEKPPPPTPPPPPKNRDSEKRARDAEKRSSDKRSRDRNKKDKDPNKDSRQGSKDMRGSILSSGMGHMGPGMGHMGGPSMGPMGGPGMGHMTGHGMNPMGGPGMGPMGAMMGQMGGHMNPMSGMGPMGGPGPMGRPMGQMSGMDPMGSAGMGQMGGHGMGQIGGHGMGQMGGSNMGGPGMGYMGHMGSMGMHNMNYMGGGGGPYMGSMGMPWMSSTMGQYGSVHGSPYGPPRPNPMGMGSMGPPGMGGPHHMPPPTSMTQTPGSDAGMNPMGSAGSESLNPPPPCSAASTDNLVGGTAGNAMAVMSSMTPLGASGNTMNAGNPMGTPPPPNSMNSMGNPMGMGSMGNSISADNPMGTPPPVNQSLPLPGNTMNAPSGRSMMGPLSMDSMGPGHGGGNLMGAGGMPGNTMNMGAGHPMGPGFGSGMGSGPGNFMNPGYGNHMSNSVNPMNSLSAMTPPTGNPLGALSSMNPVGVPTSVNSMDTSSSSILSSTVHPMSALSSMNSMDNTVRSTSLSSSPSNSMNSLSSVNSVNVTMGSVTSSTNLLPSGDSGCDKPVAPSSAPSGDTSATTDSQAASASLSEEKETPKDGVKTESEVKSEAAEETKSESKEEKMDSGKEGEENGTGKQEDRKDTKVWEDGIVREEGDAQDLRHRIFKVFLLSENYKTTAQRAKIIGDWKEKGGVLLIGYEMYRLLSSRRAYTPKAKKKKKKPEEGKDADVIDVDEEDKNKSFMTDMHGALVNPGPDLVICDEGHRIKNNHASISQSLKQIRTRRRVVLTGYPLQNNLMEYWCMVDFVRPNFLGNKTEFSNMFERPIMNGQCQDSTAEDMKIMKHRAYVLHNLLEGFVQRRGHTVLQRSLPFKHEYVFLVRMSPIQRKLYRRYINSLEESTSLAQANNNPLRAFSVGCKIWNHPDILHKSVVLKKPVIEENDLDIESSEVGGSKKKLKKSDSTSSLASTASMSSVASVMSNATVASTVSNAATLPDSASLSNVAGDMGTPNGVNSGLSSGDSANVGVPDCDTTAGGNTYSDVSNGLGANTGLGRTGPNVTFSLGAGSSFCAGVDANSGMSTSSGKGTGVGFGSSAGTGMSAVSNSSSTGTGASPGLSTTTDAPETSTGVSSSTDTNSGVSAGTEMGVGILTGTDTSTSVSTGTEKSAGVSTGTDTGTGVSTSTETSTGVSTGTGTTETSVGTGTAENGCGTPLADKKEDEHAWVGDAFDGYEPGLLEHGPKMVLLNTVIEESLSIGDKILVFSQSLSTLDIIEEFMSKRKVPRPDMDENWSKNRSYFRLDGSTSSTERERLISEFNRPTNTSSWMFLLSTRAGCLGINMIGANRVVVLDASWNPCHDCQAVCRVFRFGQVKQCYVYRLVTENTLERNIYDRQITKQGMSDRVIDEMNPDNHFSRGQMENLLKNEDQDFPYLDFSTCEDNYEDPVLISVLKKQGQWITKEPFTHESLLIDRKELRMSKKEKLQAKEGYARDKRMNITYSRPSYAAYYSGGGGSQMYIRRGPISRPIASVRPMISTPISRPTVQVVKPGVTVHQVITTTDILLPGTNTATSSGTAEPAGKIASGQKILVIKTPKGVYIRTNDGKMFAVRSKVAGTDDATPGTTTASSTVGGGNTTTTTTATAAATTVSSGTRVAISAPPPPRIFFKTPDGKLTEKNPNDVKGGASLLANIYSQTSGANAVFKRNNKGQIMRVLPAAPIRTLNRTRPTIMASAAASKVTKPPVEVIVYPRSKVISTGRACKVLDKAGEPSGKSTSTVVVQPQKDSVTASVTGSTSTVKGMESALTKADSSTSSPVGDTSANKAKDSQVMKLLAADDEENVGKGRSMMSVTAVEKKDAGTVEMAVDSSKEPSDDGDAGKANSDKLGSLSGGRLTDSAPSTPAADSTKTTSQEQTDFMAPAAPPSLTSQSSDLQRQDSSSQSGSTTTMSSQLLDTPLPHSQSVTQVPAQLASASQQSSQPLANPSQPPFNTNQQPFSINKPQQFNSQPLQQPFGTQPAVTQPVNSAPPYVNMPSSQQSYGNQPPQPPFGQQPQSFPSQPTSAQFSHHAPQHMFNSQPQHFNSQPPFNSQPSQPSFNNQASRSPFGHQPPFGNQPPQSSMQAQHAQMSNSQQQQMPQQQPTPVPQQQQTTVPQQQPTPIPQQQPTPIPQQQPATVPHQQQTPVPQQQLAQPPTPVLQQQQTAVPQQPQQQQADVAVSQPQYSHSRSDFMQTGHMRPTPPSQFHQPWGQQQQQSSYMPPPSFPDYSPYPQQQQQQQQQPQPQQPAVPPGQMLAGHVAPQQHSLSAFPHAQHLQSASSTSTSSLMNSPFGFGPINQGQGSGDSQSQDQGQNEPGPSGRPSAFRPPSGGADKPKGLEMKSTPTPPVDRERRQTPPQPTQASQPQHAPSQPPSQTPHPQPPQPPQPSLPTAPPQPQPQSQPIAHPTPQHPEGRYQDNWWSSPGMGSGSGSHSSQQGMMGATSLPSSSATPVSSYQSPHSAFTPTNPSYFHPGLSPFGMGPPPQSNFPMMGQGLGMPGSYPFLPSFHPGFMGSPFSHQGLGGAGSGFASGAGGGAGGYGFGGQGSDGMSSFRALLDETSDRGALPPQPSGSSGMGGGTSSLTPDAGNSGMGLSTSSNATSGAESGPSSSGTSMGGGIGGLGIGGGSMNGLPQTPSMPMPSSTSSMYGNSAMPLGYPGLFPMLNPMPNPMFMPMMPSPMMGQHYPMQPSHPSQPPGPLSAMGHMASMGSHMPGPGPGLPPPSGGGT